MALAKELLRTLDDPEEPLPKRLKIANNAFKSVSLPIQNREAFLLKWLSKVSKRNDIEVFELLLNWLRSNQVQNLNKAEITQEDVTNLAHVITKRLSSCNNSSLSVLIKCAIAIIENTSFDLYFKHDFISYSNLIVIVLQKIENDEELNSLISNDRLFNKNVCDEEFRKYFVKNGLESFGEVVEKFDNECILLNISKLTRQILFRRDSKEVENCVNCIFENESKSEDTFVFSLIKALKRINKKSVYKIVFNAYVINNDNSVYIYKFFIILLESIGFDFASRFDLTTIGAFENLKIKFGNSILILNELLKLLTKRNIDLNSKVGTVSFGECLKNLTTTTIALATDSNTNICEFLNTVLTADPLNVSKVAEQVLIFIVITYKQSPTNDYENLLLSLIQIFHKLKQLPNLFSVMLPSLKKGLQGTSLVKSELKYVGKYNVIESTPSSIISVFSPECSSFLTQCITSIPSWQYMNLFKCFLYHLDDLINGATSGESDVKYLELLSILLCHFMSSVRIVEYTVPVIVITKFIKEMNNLKAILEKFGMMLVKIEHNQTLMRSYLNICYTWGELCITLSYYATDQEDIFPKAQDGDSSANNITYLHSYLSKEVWSLISQRITNFGEKSCKQIMQKLCMQKLKAMQLFEEDVNVELSSSVSTSILSSIEDNWKDLISDSFSLNEIAANSNCLIRFSELILKDTIKSGNYEQLNSFTDCDSLINAMLYTSLKNISKSFNKKSKRRSSLGKIPLSARIFTCITEDVILNDAPFEMEELYSLADAFENETSEDKFSNVNFRDLSDYLVVLQVLPVGHYKSRELVILFLISVLKDLQSCSLQNNDLVKKCESIIINTTKIYENSFTLLNKHLGIIKTIINNFSSYSEMFSLVTLNIKELDHFKSIADFLISNLPDVRYVECLTLLLDFLNKHLRNKCKFYHEDKKLFAEYQKRIHLELLNLISNSENKLNLIEIYDLVLKTSLNHSNEGVNENPIWQEYFEIIKKNEFNIQHQKGIVLLLTTMIRNGSKIKVDNLDEIAWNCCKKLQVNERYREDYSKLMITLFQSSSINCFTKIISEIDSSLIEALREEHLDSISSGLLLLNLVLSSELNFEKNEAMQNILKTLIFSHLLANANNKKGTQRELAYEQIANLEISLIKNVHLFLIPSTREAILITISTINFDEELNFNNSFALAMKLLDSLLKFRKILIMDYLSVYLQHYRICLKKLCTSSNSELKLNTSDVQALTDCGYKFEKLTMKLVHCSKDMSRIAPYLIADIFKQYEQVVLYPGVKARLNKCLYSLLDLCDDKAIAYLKRSLSMASTEMLKTFYKNYSAYYKFTGKI